MVFLQSFNNFLQLVHSVCLIQSTQMKLPKVQQDLKWFPVKGPCQKQVTGFQIKDISWVDRDLDTKSRSKRAHRTFVYCGYSVSVK